MTTSTQTIDISNFMTKIKSHKSTQFAKRYQETFDVYNKIMASPEKLKLVNGVYHLVD